MADDFEQKIILQLSALVKTSEQGKRAIQEESYALLKGLSAAEGSVKQHEEHFRDLQVQVRSAKEAVEAMQKDAKTKGKDLDKARLKAGQLNEKRTMADQVLKQAREYLISLQQRFKNVDVPRIIQALRTNELQRIKEVYGLLAHLLDLDKRRSEQEVLASQGMIDRLKVVRLSEDERFFTQTFLGRSMSEQRIWDHDQPLLREEQTGHEYGVQTRMMLAGSPISTGPYDRLSASLAKIDNAY